MKGRTGAEELERLTRGNCRLRSGRMLSLALSTALVFLDATSPEAKPVSILSFPNLEFAQSPDTGRTNEPLRRELLKMEDEDQRYRKEADEIRNATLPSEDKNKRLEVLWEKQAEADKRNMKRLTEIIEEYGWPGNDLVGKDGSLTAFLIVQHGELEDQKKYFPLLKEAVGKGEADPVHAAYLEDRILMREGKEQIYGTQLERNEATQKLELWPVEDEEHLDARRATLGLESIAEYLKRFGLEYKAPNPTEVEAGAQTSAKLRRMIETAPKLPLAQTNLLIKLPAGQVLGMVSWLAHDPKTGVTWLIQRGDHADPVIAFDHEGRLLHSFGKGLYKIPHAIRLDPEGNIWTVDSGSSTVIKFNPKGEKLLQINVGGPQETSAGAFGGATDIAFAPNGLIFISDGYANARIMEYTPDGKKIHEWGSAGSGPGQFDLPHSIVVDENNVVYVADRENGRIQKFDLNGRFLGEIANLGRTYSLALGANGTLWAGTQPLNQPPGSAGWIVKLDRKTGGILGYVPVTEKAGLHCVEDAGDGQPMTDLDNKIVWFKKP